MPTEKRKFGDMGEKAACCFLQNKGYKILKTNYRKRIGEIDIIAKFNNTVHFIEVKTRTIPSSAKYGLPQEAVNYYKQKKLAKMALFYLSENNYPSNVNWQIDVIAIIVNQEKKSLKINHIENAVDLNIL